MTIVYISTGLVFRVPEMGRVRVLANTLGSLAINTPSSQQHSYRPGPTTLPRFHLYLCHPRLLCAPHPIHLSIEYYFSLLSYRRPILALLTITNIVSTTEVSAHAWITTFTPLFTYVKVICRSPI